MSKKRQRFGAGDAGVLARSYAVTHPSNLGLRRRSFGSWDQLVHAEQGVMTVRTDDGDWVVPRERAIWIPARTEYSVQMNGRVSLRIVFLRPALGRACMPRQCRAVDVSPLLRELVLHVCRRGTLERAIAEDARLVRVLVDQLQVHPAIPMRLPLPKDPRARRVAERILQAPERSLEASLAGASRRTLERLFFEETGFTLGSWARRARLMESLRLLASGDSVAEIAPRVGYTTPSAFVAAFRRELGTTPGRYFGLPPPAPKPS